MRILVAQIGARRHYAVPAFLERAGMLERFYTDACANTGLVAALARRVPERLRPPPLCRLLERNVPDVPAERIHAFPSFALARIGHATRIQNGWENAEHARKNRRFGTLVVRRGLHSADAVYVFNGAGLEILQEARRRGLRTILDQTMAPLRVVEAMLAEERDRWPGWQQEETDQQWLPLAEREEAEWPLADVILCGSEYVARTLGQAGGDQGRCRVLPYGREMPAPAPAPPETNGRPLQALFAGTVCLRKGAPYLLEAARLLRNENVRVRAVGPVRVPSQLEAEFNKYVELIGPVTRAEMSEQYARADVLVLPTLAEGSANVCYEAMAHSRPVITTPNAGSVVRDGQDGLLIPIRDADALADRLVRLAGDRPLLRSMAEQARRRMDEFTWEQYAERLVAAVGERRA